MKERKEVQISLRLPSDMLDTITMIAAGERVSVSEVVRRAIAEYLNPKQKGKA